MTSINSAVNRIVRLKYLKSLNCFDLGFWLVQSFSPERYRAGDNDVIEAACILFYNKFKPASKAHEFIVSLWAMFKEQPDYLPNYDDNGKILSFRPNYDKPGMKERVAELVDEIVLPEYEQERMYHANRFY